VRTNPRSIRLAAALGLLLLAPTGARAACPPLTPQAARDAHGLVFLGTVEAVKDSTVHAATNPQHLDGTWRIARVRMSSIWKGMPKRELWLVSPLAPDVPKLALGGTYVIYADSIARGATFGRCSRTRAYGQASEDLKALGAPTIVQRIPARKTATPN
jgi:hypothetical protein